MQMYGLLFVFLCIAQQCVSMNFGKHQFTSTENPLETWTGRWLPERKSSHLESTKLTSDRIDSDKRIPMGIYNKTCDDAKTNLTVDWDGDRFKYACLKSKNDFLPNIHTQPLQESFKIPPLYSAMHFCMNMSIEYDDVIPTYGTHRPLWPRYGEYTYVPRQRWIHNLEHGAIVMLYHPCANKYEINELRKLVVGCLYRHVITSMDTLSPERPLAIVAWGRRLQMSVVDPDLVKDFIKLYALRGPEIVARDGQYVEELVKPATIVSNENDDYLCRGV